MSQVDPAPGQSSSRAEESLHASTPWRSRSPSAPCSPTALILGLVSNPVTGAGWNATLAVLLLAGLGVLAIGYALALYARRYAGAGAVYEYLTHGAHPWVGVLTAGVFFLGTLFLGGGGIYLGVGNLARRVLERPYRRRQQPFVVGVGLDRARDRARAQLHRRPRRRAARCSPSRWSRSCPMLILAIVIVAKGGADGISLSVFDPSETGLLDLTGGGVLGGVLLGILLFVGFEAAASIGEESHDPHRSIPRAVLFTIAAAAAFYVVMAFAFSMGYGKEAVEQGAWAGDPGAVNTMATQVHRLVVRDDPRSRRDPRRDGARARDLRHRSAAASSRSAATVCCPRVVHQDVAPRHAVGRQPRGRGRSAGPDGRLVARGLSAPSCSRCRTSRASSCRCPPATGSRPSSWSATIGVSRGRARVLRPRGGGVRARAPGGRQAVAVRDRGGGRGDAGARVSRRAQAGAAHREQRELGGALLDDRHHRRGGRSGS